VVYRFDAERGELLPADDLMVKTVPGAGPRHAVFRPDNRFLYLVNELDSTFVVARFMLGGVYGLAVVAYYLA